MVSRPQQGELAGICVVANVFHIRIKLEAGECDYRFRVLPCPANGSRYSAILTIGVMVLLLLLQIHVAKRSINR